MVNLVQERSGHDRSDDQKNMEDQRQQRLAQGALLLVLGFDQVLEHGLTSGERGDRARKT